MNLDFLLSRIEAPASSWAERAWQQHDNLTKPPRSLGRVEEIAVRLCAIQQTLTPHATPTRILIFAGDHGVAHEGVSAYPPQVTAQMIANFRRGGAAINALARAANAQLHVVDVGVCGQEVPIAATDIEYSNGEKSNDETAQNAISNVATSNFVASNGASAKSESAKVASAKSAFAFHRCRVREGTNSMTQGAALSRDEVLAALAIGVAHAENAANDGVQVVAIGEMGIGNTTSASALTCALTGLSPRDVTGRGTGIDEKKWRHKIEIIERALSANSVTPLGDLPSTDRVLDLLGAVGGLEIAAMCGVCLGAAARRMAVVVDGFIATCAAAIAVRLYREVKSYLFVAHRSTEIGQGALLEILGQTPLLDLQMRLGEGSGAALCLPILAGAVAVFNEMATFESAGIDNAGE